MPCRCVKSCQYRRNEGNTAVSWSSWDAIADCWSGLVPTRKSILCDSCRLLQWVYRIIFWRDVRCSNFQVSTISLNVQLTNCGPLSLIALRGILCLAKLDFMRRIIVWLVASLSNSENLWKPGSLSTSRLAPTIYPQSNGLTEKVVEIAAGLLNKDPYLALLNYKNKQLTWWSSGTNWIFGRRTRTLLAMVKDCQQ